MQIEKLTRQANQIATFFASQPGHRQARDVASHINDFWDPRMRMHLAAHVEAGGDGLDPVVVEATRLVKLPAD